MPNLSDAGLYQLLIHVAAPLRLRVGALGECEFPAGYYVYTGSARRHLSHRLARHWAREKVLRWHIDYLTVAAPVVGQRVVALDGTPGQECALHASLGAPAAVRGFGASDCRCGGHLAWCGAQPTAGWVAGADNP